MKALIFCAASITLASATHFNAQAQVLRGELVHPDGSSTVCETYTRDSFSSTTQCSRRSPEARLEVLKVLANGYKRMNHCTNELLGIDEQTSQAEADAKWDACMGNALPHSSLTQLRAFQKQLLDKAPKTKSVLEDQ